MYPPDGNTIVSLAPGKQKERCERKSSHSALAVYAAIIFPPPENVNRKNRIFLLNCKFCEMRLQNARESGAKFIELK